MHTRVRRGSAWLLLSALILPALILTVIAAFFAPNSAAQEESERPERITVVTTEVDPFVTREGDRPTGFYWEIWEDVAAELGADVDVVWAASFPEMVTLLENGEADVAVAPLAPTAEREAIIDFSSAVVSSGPQLGAHERLRSPVSLLGALFGSRVLRILILAVAGLVILGHIIWLIERHDDDNDFHHAYPRGVFDGIWWAVTTVTTVGYGDKAPTSVRGRLVAMVAMLASLFLVGAFVSEISRDIAAQGTVEATLDNRVVAVVSDTTFADYIKAQGADTLGFASQADAFDAVERGDADIVLASPFAIASLGPEHGVSPSGSVFYEEFESFGLQQGSPWREPINGVLAELQASGSVQATIDRWLD